jgi:hypothetical protein
MKPARHICAILPGLFLFLAAASGQDSIRSFSGLFVVGTTGGFSPLAHNRAIATNADFIRLEPTLLAVSAERFKSSLARELGLKPDAPWSGKIILALRPARSLDDEVFLAPQPFLRAWNCRVELPDVIDRTRFARAITTALLLEIANRDTSVSGRSVEIPAWLADGLAQIILAGDRDQIILSTAGKTVDGLPQNRLDEIRHSPDPLARVHSTLQNFSAATFDQLSWPADVQLDGDDGGAYHASTQLFVHELLELSNGAARLRALLIDLPGSLNWQTAFFAAFHDDFKRPLDVEKWWALRVVRFASRNPGPQWTPAASRDQLAGLLIVPVEFRDSSNSLPAHAEISLQSAIRSFDAAQQSVVLETKLRDLALAQMRMTPPFAALAEGYRAALADFLDEDKKNPSPLIVNSHAVPMRKRASLENTLKRLDALDARRRAAEAAIKPDLPLS